MTDAPLSLLLAYTDGSLPGLAPGAVDPGTDRAQSLPDRLDSENDPVDDLARQRYCVVVPEGDRGRRLRDLASPLVALRTAEQRAPVETYTVPPRMSLAEAHQWHARLRASFAHPRDVPRYFLLLGDLDEVPHSVQQALALADRCPGRLCLDRDDDLAAHAARIAAHAPTTTPSASLHAATTDDTTERARARLLVPMLEQLREAHDLGELRVATLTELHTLTPQPPGTILLTVSHGHGGDRIHGFATPEQRRRDQGALVQRGGDLLRGADLPPALVPHGFWFMFACYSAGTPETSVYAPWLRDLRGGALGPLADAITRALPRPGERPFIAALPKAALADPAGPLACFGHVDVTWEYSYQHDGRVASSRPGKFTRILEDACAGHRAGALARSLARAAADAALHLAAATGEPASDRLRNLWLLHHDLAAFILLGDPAVRLTTPPAERTVSPTTISPPSPPSILPSNLLALARKLGTRRLEEALARARVSEPARKVASSLGLTIEDFRALESAYQAAARTALGLPDPKP